jgi:Flp pilus assembly protein TadD
LLSSSWPQSSLTQLDVIVEKLRQTAPKPAATLYYSAVAALLHDDFTEVVRLGEQAKAADPQYGAVYDLLGAAFLKLAQPEKAREAFLASLRLNRHDSTAYVNLGIIELQAGKKADARRYFSEALWLDPNSSVAREGLQQAR